MWGYVAGAVVALAVFLYGLRPVRRWQYRSLGGPPPLWLLGNLREFATKGSNGVFLDWNKKYGQIYKMWLGPTPVVIVNEPHAARAVLLRHNARMMFGQGARSLEAPEERELNSAGIVNVRDKERHRELRMAWLPMFNSASLDASTALVNSCAERLCDNLAADAAVQPEINIWREYGRMTMDVVGTVAFGVEFHTQDKAGSAHTEEAQKLVNSARVLLSSNPFSGSVYIALATLLPTLAPLVGAFARTFPDKFMREAREGRRVLRRVATRLVRETRAQLGLPAEGEAGAACRVAGPEALSGKAAAGAEAARVPTASGEAPRRKSRCVQPGSFLHLMITSHHADTGAAFSEIEAVAQAFTFLIAGYETTATTLGFATYCLAAHPDKAAKAVEEVVREAGAGPVTAARLANMPYLEACLKEALRLFSPATIVARELTEDATVLGHALPKPTNVMVPIYAMHHDATYYRDPEAYVPERWLEGSPEHSADDPARAWMPFGEGMRSCVGMRLATLEAKITLAIVLRRFAFELSPGQVPLKLECPVLLKPKTGVFVKVRPREGMQA